MDVTNITAIVDIAAHDAWIAFHAGWKAHKEQILKEEELKDPERYGIHRKEEEELRDPDQWDWDKAETKPPVLPCKWHLPDNDEMLPHEAHIWFEQRSAKSKRQCPGVEKKLPVEKCFNCNVHVSHYWYTDLNTKFQKLWHCLGVEKKSFMNSVCPWPIECTRPQNICSRTDTHTRHDWYSALPYQKMVHCPGVEKKIVKELPIEQCPRLGVEKRKHLAHIWDIDCVTPADQRSRWCPGP